MDSPSKIMEQLERTAAGWKTHAPSKKFYNLSQTEFEARVQLSREARERVAEFERQLAAAINQRDDVDKENKAIERNVAKGVAGDSDYGEDSDLWESIGRKRKSERRRPGKSKNSAPKP